MRWYILEYINYRFLFVYVRQISQDTRAFVSVC